MLVERAGATLTILYWQHCGGEMGIPNLAFCCKQNTFSTGGVAAQGSSGRGAYLKIAFSHTRKDIGDGRLGGEHLLYEVALGQHDLLLIVCR